MSSMSPRGQHPWYLTPPRRTSTLGWRGYRIAHGWSQALPRVPLAPTTSRMASGVRFRHRAAAWRYLPLGDSGTDAGRQGQPIITDAIAAGIRNLAQGGVPLRRALLSTNSRVVTSCMGGPFHRHWPAPAFGAPTRWTGT